MTSRFFRFAVVVVALMALLGTSVPAPASTSAAAYQNVWLRSGGISRTYTPANTYSLYTTFGSVPGGEYLYLSVYPDDFFTTYRRIDVYFFTHGPMVPGTYTAAGFQGYYSQPGLVVLDFIGSGGGQGGTFTINAIDHTNPSALLFDISWTTYWGNGKGHAVFASSAPPPDTTPPTFTSVPGRLVYPAGTTDGAWLSAHILATDDRTYAAIACDVTGTTTMESDFYLQHQFPINAPDTDTTVTCTGTDEAGNTATASFAVHVQGAWEQVGALNAEIASWNLGKTGTSLIDKLVTVQRMLAAGKNQQALENLDAFSREVDAVKLDDPSWLGWQYWQITSSVGQIKDVIG